MFLYVICADNLPSIGNRKRAFREVTTQVELVDYSQNIMVDSALEKDLSFCSTPIISVYSVDPSFVFKGFMILGCTLLPMDLLVSTGIFSVIS